MKVFWIVSTCVVLAIGCASNQEPPHVSPSDSVVESKPDTLSESEVTQSYEDCFNYCEEAMDQAGQVRDECPQTCREDPGAFTQDDLMNDDEVDGLMITKQCLSECHTNSLSTKKTGGCKQRCCVQSCERRQDYNGSGMGPECPGMCREFLARSKK